MSLTYTGWLVVIECGGCGWQYAIPQHYHEEAKAHGHRWRCPNRACSWQSVGYNQSCVQELERALGQARKWAADNRERSERAERRAIAQRGVTTRLKNRIAHGVCPCCKRSFQNLAQHMKGQHPGFTKDGEPSGEAQ